MDWINVLIITFSVIATIFTVIAVYLNQRHGKNCRVEKLVLWALYASIMTINFIVHAVVGISIVVIDITI